ncbi:hypothetical protein SAMN04489751_1905 [Brevibacterium sandarakinum]|uniref:Uncharacterized protein n=1 Tax=Brevibacterium sandarakinum TaxID=629680 RepID=A0A1H1RTP6_BRESA|nr:hypothetical protein [Brevibacterium sandarakinum]SDS39054.1 hypothetical protein SAMN04489751_1905 [Brevibacterium sandarakinum]
MTDRQWTHRVLDDPADLDATPAALSAAEAQPWANFVVFTPDRLPAGTHLSEQSLRREAPPGRVGDSMAGRTPWSANNPAAFRFEVRGDGRRLRVKQFLYDWAFPALDHPALWESRTSAERLDEHHLVWHGIDYMGHQGASARIARTMIELSVLDGTFTREEITDLYRSLRPVDSEAATAIAATPFAALSYWARRPEASVIAVPLGLWNLRQEDTATLTWRPIQDGHAPFGPSAVPHRLSDLVLESTTTHHGHSPVASEHLYSGGPDRGRELRLHTLNPEHLPRAIEPESHPAEHEDITVAGHHVRLAFIDNAYGPFDAVLDDANGNPTWRLLASAHTHTDRRWFLRVLDDLLDVTDSAP